MIEFKLETITNTKGIHKFFFKHYTTPDGKQMVNTYPSLVPGDATIKNMLWIEVTHKSTVIGYIGYQPCDNLIELHKFLIHLDYRGKGYAKKILGMLGRSVYKRGFKKIYTNVFVNNMPMIVPLLNCGYEIEGRVISGSSIPNWYTLGIQLEQ
jgi:GNAT superfamily N-acetyltransferase